MNLDHACNSEHYNETPSTCRTSKIRRREKSEKDNETHRDEEEWFSAEEDCTDESRGEVEESYSSLQAALETLKNDTSIEEQMEPSASAVTEPSAPDLEPDEFEIAHAYHQSAFEFYQQNLHRELQDDVLPHELNELHERSLKLTMELYKEQTKQLCEEAVEIYRDALLQTVEKFILELREIAQARMLSLTAVMSEDMRIIYSEMVSQSRQLFIETASITQDIAHLDQAYATAIDYAINTFDLATNDMTESKSIPRRLLLSEMSSTYKMMKRDLSWSTTTAEENTTDTSSRFHTAEHNNNIIRPIFAVRSVVTTTPSGYDQSPYLEVNNVNNVSRHFEPDNARELEEELRRTLRNAEIEKMNTAVEKARNAYELTVSQRNESTSSWVATRSIPAELHSMRMSHKKAQQAALQTFDQLTRDVDTLLVTDFRNELLSEFQQRQQKLEILLHNESLP